MKKKKLESVIQKEILAYLKSKGIYTIKTMRSNMSGVPDIICCAFGAFLAIEVKAEGKVNNTSELQKLQLKAIDNALGYTLVTDNVDDVERILRRIGYEIL